MENKLNNFEEISEYDLAEIEGGIGLLGGALIVGGVIVVGFAAGAVSGYYANKK
ncbi:Blp family class II bacteriocin [Enterococcus plantarum]|uniref:Blp family class II bacteriocin n=1 Tax=Enterococcus plantarum TaxID=1077675 RepID=UPI0009F68B5D|nr:class IIb bacteriocin, lactobin A/cerein 7B family [Enterococcus plantarum]